MSDQLHLSSVAIYNGFAECQEHALLNVVTYSMIAVALIFSCKYL